MKAFCVKKYRKTLAILGIIMAATLCFSACSNKDTGENKEKTEITKEAEPETTLTAAPEVTEEVTPTPESTPEPTPTPEATPTMSPQDIYAEAVEKSLVYMGNNYRLKKFIEKLSAGQDVYVAALGGSVTEGAGASSNDKGYAYLFAEDLSSNYAPAGSQNLHFVNAGLSGTPSSLGIMRYKQDVVDLLSNVPDLLIIEFAVNDYKEVTNTRAYESLVYEALSQNEECAVILLCSVSKSAWNTQDSYIGIAKHYSVPLVSMKNAVYKTGNNARISESLYFYDDYHPSGYGHTLTKNCLMNLVSKVDEAQENVPLDIPADSVKGRDFTGLTLIDSKNIPAEMKPGSFGSTDENVVSMYFTKRISFPDNFYHKAGEDNTPLTLKLNCKNILINYKTSAGTDFGNAEFYIDGNLVATAEGHSAGGWNNCNVILVLDEKEASEHILEIKMAEDSIDKAFTVLAIGYTE